MRAHDAARRLRTFCASGNHQRWLTRTSLADEGLFDLGRIQGHRQLTDVFLLGVATLEGGCLATFDRAIPLGAVRRADPDRLLLIPA